MKIKFENINLDVLAGVGFTGNYCIKMPYKKLLPKIAAGRCKVVYMQRGSAWPALSLYSGDGLACLAGFLRNGPLLLNWGSKLGLQPFLTIIK